MIKVIGLLLLFCAPAPAQAPAEIRKFTIDISHINRTTRGISREPTKLRAEIYNADAARRIKSVDFQFDVIDQMRRVVKERLFISISDYGLGDRTIDTGKSKTWTAELGITGFPAGCDSYGTVYSGSSCIADIKVNVVVFKDGSKWERTGWKDEPNPNKKP